MLKGKKILIGVTSGIAIYKVLNLISNLRKLGADVKVIMTENATKFVNPLTFETISNNPVYTDMWIHESGVLHIDITNDIDLFLIAPATANTIAKVNSGIADNLLTTAILASKSQVVFALAMNTLMIENPITKRNIKSLREYGYKFIEANKGQLACNTFGNGRMSEPEEIIEYIEYILSPKDLIGKKIIITSGGAISRLDPVRYITNDSSGKTGYELAKNARNRGAEVVYITGKVKTKELKNVKNIKFSTNKELKDAIENEFNDSDYLIMAAAPVDYEFIDVSNKKIKKSDENINYAMKKSEDILKYFGNIKENQIIIGFAAETDNVIENASNKLYSKNIDYIIANNVSEEGCGFDVDTNKITILGKNIIKKFDLMSKKEMANNIISELVK